MSTKIESKEFTEDIALSDQISSSITDIGEIQKRYLEEEFKTICQFTKGLFRLGLVEECTKTLAMRRMKHTFQQKIGSMGLISAKEFIKELLEKENLSVDLLKKSLILLRTIVLSKNVYCLDLNIETTIKLLSGCIFVICQDDRFGNFKMDYKTLSKVLKFYPRTLKCMSSDLLRVFGNKLEISKRSEIEYHNWIKTLKKHF